MFYRTLCLLCTLSYPVFSLATSFTHESALQVSIIAEDGRLFPVYDVENQSYGSTYRAWLEAEIGQNYAIRVVNNSNRRMGLVIAVDGRNIISGQKSNLVHTERMYILGPWQSATYDGWRTSNRKINQFFFTDAENSYAGAWQDHSAMGVIAVAAYNEKDQYRPRVKKNVPSAIGRKDMPTELKSFADRAEASSTVREKNKQAGTGFGQEKYSYARVVTFRPMQVAMGKFFYKYEWRDSLCQRGIIVCYPNSPNRFWPEHEQGYGYVPHPPA